MKFSDILQVLLLNWLLPLRMTRVNYSVVYFYCWLCNNKHYFSFTEFNSVINRLAELTNSNVNDLQVNLNNVIKKFVNSFFEKSVYFFSNEGPS